MPKSEGGSHVNDHVVYGVGIVDGGYRPGEGEEEQIEIYARTVDAETTLSVQPGTDPLHVREESE